MDVRSVGLTLTCLMALLTHNGAEETSPEWPYVKVDTALKAHQTSFLFHYAIVPCVLAVCAISAFVCCTCGEDDPSAEAQQSPPGDLRQVLVHSSKKEKKKIVSKLLEQKKDIVKLMKELQSQCLEVVREKVENKEKLQLVEKELENETVDNRQELLKEKENLLKSKWKLEEKKTDKEKVLLQTERLLQTIDAATGEEDKLQSQWVEVDREKVKHREKLQSVATEVLQTIDAAPVSQVDRY
ncbi:uncharacterized protein LOC127377366 [Dicentrarchus labrax]|uniref:uncharacterized protein LOC127377366 n=1 Tax=Dicentrarchus labrax TaxID=13489 RepID=UPI0021F569EB|nr:uncharacterized protein LOC127377366 [Dicentrarchus labrax]